MNNDELEALKKRHLRITTPSPWVRRFCPLVQENGPVLDLASGGGRHARLFLERGHPVTAIDRNDIPLEGLSSQTGAEIIIADLETGAPVFSGGGPLDGRTYQGVVVVNYLFRPVFEELIDALEPGGVLIYETFALGNEEFARPRNPDHLLRSGELLELVRSRLQVVAYEHGITHAAEIPGVKQRLVAVKNLEQSAREDGEPAPLPINPA